VSALEVWAAQSVDPAKYLKMLREIKDAVVNAPTQAEKLELIKEQAALLTRMGDEERAFRKAAGEAQYAAELEAFNAARTGDVAAEAAAMEQAGRYKRAIEIGDLYRKMQDFKKLDEAVTGIKDTWADPVVHHAITAHAKAQQAMMHMTGVGAALSVLKKNLTARNLVSGINNMGSNMLLQAIRTGDPLAGGAELVQGAAGQPAPRAGHAGHEVARSCQDRRV
jgi:hypothetical protein